MGQTQGLCPGRQEAAEAGELEAWTPADPTRAGWEHLDTACRVTWAGLAKALGVR